MSKQGLFNYGQDIVMTFSPPLIGCVVKKGLQKGGSRAPQDPPGCALVTDLHIVRCILQNWKVSQRETSISAIDSADG